MKLLRTYFLSEFYFVYLKDCLSFLVSIFSIKKKIKENLTKPNFDSIIGFLFMVIQSKLKLQIDINTLTV